MMQPSQFASRLTLFAILSSIETDLRACLREHVLQHPLAQDPYPAALRKKLTERHQQYHGPEPGDIPDDLLLEYADFPDAFELLLRHKTTLSVDLLSELDTHSQQLSKLTPVRNRVMHSRPLEPDDFSVTYD